MESTAALGRARAEDLPVPQTVAALAAAEMEVALRCMCAGSGQLREAKDQKIRLDQIRSEENRNSEVERLLHVAFIQLSTEKKCNMESARCLLTHLSYECQMCGFFLCEECEKENNCETARRPGSRN